MPKNIRQRISHAIQTTFRLSSNKSKIKSFCCSVKKPNDYEYISYQQHKQKQRSTNNDYIDLRECYSWSLSCSKDSGISIDLNENSHPLQSTKIYSDDSSSLSTLSNISAIRYDSTNISHLDVTTKQSTIECCRCQCHHYINSNHLLTSQTYQQKQIKTKIYPFIF